MSNYNLPPDDHESSYTYYGSEERRAAYANVALFLIAGVLVPLILAYLFGTRDEIQVFSIIIGLVCLVIGLNYPFWGMVFFITLLYTRPEDMFPSLRGMRFTLIASVVTVLSVLIQKIMDKENPIRTPINTYIVGFAVIAIVSSIPHSNTESALQEVLKLAALVLMVHNLVRNTTKYRTLVNVILVLTAYLSCYAAWLFFSGHALQRNDSTGEVPQAQGTGTFGDPNDLAASIVAGLALTLCCAMREKGMKRFGYFLLTLPMMYGIFLCNSRGGTIAMLGTVIVFFMSVSRSKALAILLSIVLAIGIIRFGPSRMASLDTDEESANSRFYFWINGTKFFLRSPVIGIGYGNFAEENGGMTAHNTFVLCYAELGLIGYFFWMGSLYYSFVPLWRPLLQRPKRSIEEERERLRNPFWNIKIPLLPTAAERNQLTKATPPPRPPEYYDLLGARLALAGYLMAAFWISRTYVPILYLIISLPIAQQIASQAPRKNFPLTFLQHVKDMVIIFLLCFASIYFIYRLSLALE